MSGKEAVQILEDVRTRQEEEEMEEISIEFTDQDLEELQGGIEFNWEYNGVKVSLYKEEEIETAYTLEEN